MAETIHETLARLAPDVEPVEREPLRYRVRSKTRAGWWYVVDKTEYVPNGSCTCDKFLKYGIRGRLERGVTVGPATKCEHIRRVETYMHIVDVWNKNVLLEQDKRQFVELTAAPLPEPEREPPPF